LKVTSYLIKLYDRAFRAPWQAFFAATLTIASIVGIARFQHRGESCRFRFASFTGAGLFEASPAAKLLQGLFPVELLFQSAKRLVDRFTFSESNFGHANPG
jgi:hypothetical protein